MRLRAVLVIQGAGLPSTRQTIAHARFVAGNAKCPNRDQIHAEALHGRYFIMSVPDVAKRLPLKTVGSGAGILFLPRLGEGELVRHGIINIFGCLIRVWISNAPEVPNWRQNMQRSLWPLSKPKSTCTEERFHNVRNGLWWICTRDPRPCSRNRTIRSSPWEEVWSRWFKCRWALLNDKYLPRWRPERLPSKPYRRLKCQEFLKATLACLGTAPHPSRNADRMVSGCRHVGCVKASSI
jgi:hypothetical protein